MEITSVNNDLVKETVKLQQKNIELKVVNSCLRGLKQLKKHSILELN